MAKQADKRKAQKNPYIQDELTAYATERFQGIIMVSVFACFFIILAGIGTGFWRMLIGRFPEDGLSMPMAIGIMVVISYALGAFVYYYWRAVKLIRRGIAVVQNCTPSDVLLIVEYSLNGKGLYWFMRIVDEERGASFMVRTLTTVDERTAIRINETYGLMYRTPDPHDPIVIQTIQGAITCEYSGQADEEGVTEESE